MTAQTFPLDPKSWTMTHGTRRLRDCTLPLVATEAALEDTEALACLELGFRDLGSSGSLLWVWGFGMGGSASWIRLCRWVRCFPFEGLDHENRFGGGREYSNDVWLQYLAGDTVFCGSYWTKLSRVAPVLKPSSKCQPKSPPTTMQGGNWIFWFPKWNLYSMCESKYKHIMRAYMYMHLRMYIQSSVLISQSFILKLSFMSLCRSLCFSFIHSFILSFIHSIIHGKPVQKQWVYVYTHIYI